MNIILWDLILMENMAMLNYDNNALVRLCGWLPGNKHAV